MEDSFGINMLTLVHGQPMVLGIKDVIRYYIEHRQEVIERRTRHDLKVTRDRLHIVEGLRIALDNLDEVIDLITSSKDREQARQALMERFGLTEIQANAILDMRLVQLTNLERGKLDDEYQELLARIADFEDILNRPERVLAMIKEDLADVKKKYGDARRTEISREISDFNVEDFIDDHEVVITLSNRGYIKRLPLDTYKAQRRGGKGISATTIRSEDYSSGVVVTSVLGHVLFFTNQGRVFSSRVYNLPEASRQAKGMPLINFIDLRADERVTTLVAAREFDEKRHMMMITRQGIIKKVALSAFQNIRRSGLIAVNLRPEDELVGVIRVVKGDVVMVTTANGQAILFEEDQVRPMGRNAAGVKGIGLDPNNYVIGLDKYREGADVLIVTKHGYGKRVPLSEFKTQNRGGKGVKSIELTSKNGEVVATKIVSVDDELVILTSEGQIIRLEVEDISVQKRYARGVLLMRLPDNDHIVSIARFRTESEE